MFKLILIVLIITNKVILWKVGIGKSDITGPTTQINMMGYASLKESTYGISSRLQARSFIFQDNNGSLSCYSSVDVNGIHQSMSVGVSKWLSTNIIPGLTYKNTILSATHTHAGPGAQSWRILQDATTFGFDQESLNAVVNGITSSIKKAYDNIKPANIYIKSGILTNNQMNRSPQSQLNNPDIERNKYSTDTDLNMYIIKINSYEDNIPMGVINFYAVHAHSAENTNRYISSDNKGQASQLFEKKIGGNFIAAFGQSNEGDVSSHNLGTCCDWKQDGKMTCDEKTINIAGFNYSCTGEVGDCNNNPIKCLAHGKGQCESNDLEYCQQDIESAKQSGQLQQEIAYKQQNEAIEKIDDGISFIHQQVQLPDQKIDEEFLPCRGDHEKWCNEKLNIQYNNNKTQLYKIENSTQHYFSNKLCTPAAGQALGAGTIDGSGPGLADLIQGDSKHNPFLDTLSWLLSDPTEQQKDCHQPKPILLNLGKNPTHTSSCWDKIDTNQCASWTDVNIPFQIIRLGQVLIPAVPSEWTTTMGRRLRKILLKEFNKDKELIKYIPIAGLSNVYIDQVTTFEEQQALRQEGGSTLFGPMEGPQFLSIFSKLAKSMTKNIPIDEGNGPPDLNSLMFSSFIPSVGWDACPWLICSNIGKISSDVNSSYKKGNRVIVKFLSGNLRNNFDKIDSQFYVLKLVSNEWIKYRNDNDWDTTIKWERSGFISYVQITWKTNISDVSSKQKIMHKGYAKTSLLSDKLSQYEGYSSEFNLM